MQDQKNYKSSIAMTFMDESQSDVVFIVENQRIPAIKSYLAYKSEYFQKMFSGSFKEANQKEIHVPYLKAEPFKVMLWYLYSEELDIKDTGDHLFIMQVYQCSHLYQLEHLMNWVILLLIRLISIIPINVNRLYDLYDFARFYDVSKLIITLDAFMGEHDLQVFQMNEQEALSGNGITDSSFVACICLQKECRWCSTDFKYCPITLRRSSGL